MSKILVITTSLRAKSNSDILAERLIAGAKDAGHEVEHISLAQGKRDPILHRLSFLSENAEMRAEGRCRRDRGKGQEYGYARVCHPDLLLRDERTDEDAA